MLATNGNSLKINIIIPTYNRGASLRALLDSLAAQTYPMDQVDVLVIDDGSTDGTANIIKSDFPFRLHYHYQSNQGDAAARNLGAQKAAGEFLVFLDDDITITPVFMASIIHELNKDSNAIVIGTTVPCPGEQTTAFGARYTYLTTNHTPNSSTGEVSFTECVSHLMAIRRALYIELGMMRRFADNGADIWCDVEFGYRAFKRGIRFVRCAEAVGYHHDMGIRDRQTYCRRMERAGTVAAHLFNACPDLEQYLPMFLDKGYISLSTDSTSQIVRKLSRSIVGNTPMLQLLEHLCQQLERNAPDSCLLNSLYRWIVGSYIFRGYRKGLSQRCQVSSR